EGAVQIVFRKEIEASAVPEDTRQEKTRQYREELANPYVAASRGYLDDVILPEETRARFVAGLESLQAKRQSVPQRKHGNIPL
ncbi:MAG: carboxyl transferase domain-containing protein, partial [Anaerolineaceae bacterium]